MKQITRFFILFILYLIGLFFYTWRNLLVIKNDNYETKNLYKDMIKTGDIFLLSNTKNTKILGDLIFMINYFHPSIALWERGNLYILEYAFYPNLEGFNKVPFDVWLKYNKNKRILHCPLEVSNSNVRKKLEKRLSKVFDNNQKKINSMSSDFNWDWIRFLFRMKRNLNLENITCTEVLAMVIYESGIAKKDKGISYYHASDFIQLRNFSLTDNFRYPVSYICNLKYLIKIYV